MQSFVQGFEVDGRRLRWVGLRWGGPPNGEIVVLDCGGTVVARAPAFKGDDFGPERLSLGPIVSDEPTLQEIYTSGWGTNIRMQAVAWLQFRDGAVVYIWRHAAHEISSFPGMGPDTDLEFQWRLRGGKLLVSGMRTTERRAYPLPKEVYCWRRGPLSFVPCKN